MIVGSFRWEGNKNTHVGWWWSWGGPDQIKGSAQVKLNKKNWNQTLLSPKCVLAEGKSQSPCSCSIAGLHLVKG